MIYNGSYNIEMWGNLSRQDVLRGQAGPILFPHRPARQKYAIVETTATSQASLLFQSMNFQVNFGIALSCFVNTCCLGCVIQCRLSVMFIDAAYVYK